MSPRLHLECLSWCRPGRPRSRPRREHDRHRRDRADHVPGRDKSPRGLVDPELDDGVSLLVGGVEPSTAWIDGKVAREVDARRGVADRRQQAAGRVDPEPRDAVVPAVRSVEELARGMDGDFRGALGTSVARRFGRHGLQLAAQLARGRIVLQRAIRSTWRGMWPLCSMNRKP